MSNAIYTPHNQFVKKQPSNIHVVKDLLQANLPQSLYWHIDFNQLRLTNKEFVTEVDQGSRSDLVYETKIAGKSGYLYILLEHQSTSDALIAFRLWQYTIALMDSHIRSKGEKKLPIVIPICLYHAEKPYVGVVFTIALLSLN